MYIDPDGMEVDITHLMKGGDGSIKTAIDLLLDLTEQTGLFLSIQNTDGRFTLEYAKDENGKEEVSVATLFLLL